MGSAIVIGAGPNGLAAALTLAGKGHQVTVLEARDEVGGRAAAEEFHPGFRTTGVLHDTERVQPWVIDALALGKHGLQTQAPPALLLAGPDRRAIVLPSSPEAAVASLDAYRPGLGGQWRAWKREVDDSAGLVRALSKSAPPDIAADADIWPLLGHGLSVLRLGRAKLMGLLRTGPLCAEDWLDEWFDDRTLQAGLVLPSLLGTWMGPRSPTSAAALRFSEALSGEEVVGGPAALIVALQAACALKGVDVRTGAPVQRIRVSEGRALGVRLDDGQELSAETVLSTVGPRQTMRALVDPLALPFSMDEATAPIRTRGIVAKVDLALSAALVHPAHPDIRFERIRVAPDMVSLERAFDDAKHRRLPAAPALDIRQPSLSDASLAPEGQHTASILVFGATHELDGGWDDQARGALLEATLGVLEAHLPGARAAVLGHRTQTPVDLAQSLGLEGGHLFHGELALDQLLSFRPHPRLAHYKTDIGGLFLGGAGMHPAGGFTCAQGVLAARAVG
jgi:phytoene dehydrogenase-like protein